MGLINLLKGVIMFTELKTILIGVLTLVIILATIWINELNGSIAELKLDITKLESKVAEKEVYIKQQQYANDLALIEAKAQVKTVTREIVRIEKEYVPQIEYVKEYIGDVNKTSCENADSLLVNFIY